MVSLSVLGLNFHKNEGPPAKSDSVLVCEALMMELETQIKDVERLSRNQDKEAKKRRNLADYSWLATAPVKSYEIPQIERLALESLASRVEAKDCSEIITQFRALVDGIARRPDELPRIMRTIIEKYLTEKPDNEGDTMMNWITRSMSNLRTFKSQSSSKVYPAPSTSHETTVGDTRRVKSMSDFVPLAELPV